MKPIFDTAGTLLSGMTLTWAETWRNPSGFTSGGSGVYYGTADGQALTVFVDAWGVDLEGPDELVKRVTEHLAD